MTTSKGKIIAYAVPLLVALSACGLSSSGTNSTQSNYDQKKLCAEFVAFLKSEFAVDAEDPNSGDPSKPVGLGSVCILNRTGGLRVGMLDMSQSSSMSADRLRDPSFEAQKGFDDKVWIGPNNNVRVQSGSWVGTMDLSKLELNDQKTRDSIEFLIKATNEVNG
ncbi:hypothetical protein [Nocardia heshunensis]